MMNNKIVEICREYTNLNKVEVNKIIEVSKSLDLMADFYERDVFLDVLTQNKKEAIVVSHGKPKSKSIYDENVVGKKALEANEPGVIKTLHSGITTRGIKALTQEYKLVKQTIQPISLQDKIIGVLIVETDISSELKNEFNIDINKKNQKSNFKDFIDLVKMNNFLIDDLNSAVLVFDEKGLLKIRNKHAIKIYQKLGYADDIQDMHYDDINLEHIKLKEILKYDNCDKQYREEHDICIGKFSLKIKTIISKNQEFKIIKIIEDITDLKAKEAELVLKSVAIKEANHRIKNNLQTVISIISRQSRLSKNDEVKACLDNIRNRVFAIFSIHHLLMDRMDDSISILQAINLLIANIQSSYCDNKDINIYIIGEDFDIEGEKSTALLLVINEVIQNCYDHAFSGRERGSIKIMTNKEENYKSIAIIDDGNGIDKKDSNKRKTLGTFIIDSYITQVLKGTLEIQSDKNGTKVLIKVPS